MRLALRFTAALAFSLSVVHAQTPPPAPQDIQPTLEVAAIKPSDPSSRNQGFNGKGRQLTITNENVLSLIMFAYGVHPKQIVDGPPWMESERFDVHGVTNLPGEPTREQFQTLMRQLLAERFNLTFHRGKRELPVYTITVAKGGPKLQPSMTSTPPSQNGNGGSGEQTMRYSNNNMDDFALGMQYFLDRPVVDRTGLKGRYDFTLQWNPRMTTNPDGSNFPDLFTAIQEQLGLKLNPVKDQVDAIVIDKLERPSAN